MTRPLSAAEQDQQDAMTALRQPAKPQALDTRSKVIPELEAKIFRIRRENQKLVDLNKDLKIDVQMLTRELRVVTAERDRLRAAEEQA